MKTFSDFILEAENISSQIAQLRAKARMLRQKGDDKGALSVEQEAGRLQAGTQARIFAELNKDKPKPESRSSNRPTFRDTPISSVGTTSGRSRRIVNIRTGEVIGTSDSPDVITSYTDPESSGGKRTFISRSGTTRGTRKNR